MKKNIIGFPGYEIDESGIVYSLKSNRILNTLVTSGARVRIGLMKDGVQHKRPVSRLVAEAFIPNPDNKPQVDHIDGNRSNNHVSNLRWVTDQENKEYQESQGITNYRKKRVEWDGNIFESITDLAKHISSMRGSKLNTIRKEIQRARYGIGKLYGKSIRYL